MSDVLELTRPVTTMDDQVPPTPAPTPTPTPKPGPKNPPQPAG